MTEELSTPELKRDLALSRKLCKDLSGDCRLCKGPNIVRSHIFPRWMWQVTRYPANYSEKNLAGRNRIIGGGESHVVQGELKEPMLCSKCDSLFGQEIEGYIKSLWSAWENIPKPTGPTIIPEVAMLDYKKCKLFALLSVWRSAKSSFETYEAAKIAEPHCFRIQDMLAKMEPGPDTEFPVTCQVDQGGVLKRSVMPALQHGSEGGVEFIKLIVAGASFRLWLTHQFAPPRRLQSDGKFYYDLVDLEDVDEDYRRGIRSVLVAKFGEKKVKESGRFSKYEKP